MVEAASILGGLAAVLLLISVVAWAKLLRGPPLQRADGGTDMDFAQGEVASELLFWAVGLSIAAAFLAIAGRIFA
jgi:hypothetical protein